MEADRQSSVEERAFQIGRGHIPLLAVVWSLIIGI